MTDNITPWWKSNDDFYKRSHLAMMNVESCLVKMTISEWCETDDDPTRLANWRDMDDDLPGENDMLFQREKDDKTIYLLRTTTS
jgi:hypothetical protein